jgi:heme/copper-type cytochrome/quinol oxidase subunit 2
MVHIYCLIISIYFIVGAFIAGKNFSDFSNPQIHKGNGFWTIILVSFLFGVFIYIFVWLLELGFIIKQFYNPPYKSYRGNQKDL